MWSYDRIVGQVIRPERTLYDSNSALPGPVFDLEGQAFRRDDFEVRACDTEFNACETKTSSARDWFGRFDKTRWIIARFAGG